MVEETKALSLEEFSAEKAQITEMAIKYKGLIIKGVDDKSGYSEVDTARKSLKATRVRIQKTGKELRDEANKFSKKVIEVEKDIVALIEPTERELEEKLNDIDAKRERIKRQESLPNRKERLAELGADTYSDNQLLDWSDVEFESVIMREKQAKLEREQKALEEERLKLEQEKIEAAKKTAEAEAEKKRLAELEEARKEAAEQAAKEAEAEKQRAITAERERAEKAAKEAEEAKAAAVKAEQEKAEREKQAILDKQKADEQAKIEAQEKARLAEKAKAEADQAERERLEKRKRYTDWLKKNGYTEELKDHFKIEREGSTFTLLKVVDSIKI